MRVTDAKWPQAPRRGWLAAGAACVLLAGPLTSASGAEPAKAPSAANVVTITAGASQEAVQDWLTMTLTATREGNEAAAVQAQLAQAVKEALAVAKPMAGGGALEVRTGSFGVYPRQNGSGRIVGWQGSAEVILEGRDFLRISTTAGRVASMDTGQVVFSLSPEARRKLEGEIQAQAIERFKSKANEVARSFGFAGYALKEVNVGTDDQGVRPMFRQAMSSSAKMSLSEKAVPVEPGTAQVSVTVSGSIQLQ